MTALRRREFACALAALPAGLGLAGRVAAAGAPAPTDGVARNAESIHQQVRFAAPRAHLYAALTEARQFDAASRLSEAMQSGKMSGSQPTRISRRVGGSFALFGGYLTGIQIELLPSARIVQAWRAGSWKPGEYSIVSFVLDDDAGGTRLSFDHRGFPDGAAEQLAHGWQVNYWQPLASFLATAAR